MPRITASSSSEITPAYPSVDTVPSSNEPISAATSSGDGDKHVQLKKIQYDAKIHSIREIWLHLPVIQGIFKYLASSDINLLYATGDKLLTGRMYNKVGQDPGMVLEQRWEKWPSADSLKAIKYLTIDLPNIMNSISEVGYRGSEWEEFIEKLEDNCAERVGLNPPGGLRRGAKPFVNPLLPVVTTSKEISLFIEKNAKFFLQLGSINIISTSNHSLFEQFLISSLLKKIGYQGEITFEVDLDTTSLNALQHSNVINIEEITFSQVNWNGKVSETDVNIMRKLNVLRWNFRDYSPVYPIDFQDVLQAITRSEKKEMLKNINFTEGRAWMWRLMNAEFEVLKDEPAALAQQTFTIDGIPISGFNVNPQNTSDFNLYIKILDLPAYKIPDLPKNVVGGKLCFSIPTAQDLPIVFNQKAFAGSTVLVIKIEDPDLTPLELQQALSEIEDPVKIEKVKIVTQNTLQNVDFSIRVEASFLLRFTEFTINEVRPFTKKPVSGIPLPNFGGVFQELKAHSDAKHFNSRASEIAHRLKPSKSQGSMEEEFDAGTDSESYLDALSDSSMDSEFYVDVLSDSE